MKKKFIITLFIIIEIISLGFCMPQVSYADEEDVFDNDKNMPKLAKPIGQFLCFIPDAIIEQCQKLFVSSESIKRDELEVEQEKSQLGKNEQVKYYSIKYSPAIIFSGTVPAFDVNFINPGENKSSTDSVKSYIQKNEATYRTTNSLNNEDEYNQILENIKQRGYDGVVDNREYMFSNDYSSTIQYDIYYYTDDKSTEDTSDDVVIIETIGQYGTKAGDNLVRRNYVYGKQEVPIVNGAINGAKIEYNSIAQNLQNTIATWYNALRRIALIGLLSALVYIGIRIVTSSVAQDKAKYKSMLKDWLVAICILFTLHYIMSITVTMVQSITDVLKASAMSSEGEDIMLTTMRNNIANAKSWGSVLVQTVLYFIVAVEIVMFTVQYLRRTIYIAFLTIIAPLITLTYPLDKIKDKQSQAFDMWIKDYIFFMLLQVVHLLVYYMLVGQSLDLAESGNWVFAIVAISCLIPAEKIIKKMFGFEKSKTVGSLAAGATGALIMNAINKIRGVGGAKKGGASTTSSSTDSNTNIRTTDGSATSNALASLRGEEPAQDPLSQNDGGMDTDTALKGAAAVAGKYGKAAVKSGIKTAAKVGVGAPLAVFGFASGAANGDLGTAVTNAAAGAAAGSSFAGNVASGIMDGGYIASVQNTIDDVKDVWNKGAYGEQFAQNANEARLFKRKEDYQELKQKYGDKLTDEKIRTMMQYGIKDKKNMDKVLGSKNMDEAIKYYTLAQKCPNEIYYDDKKLQMYLEDVVEDLGLSLTDIKTMKENMKQFR